MASNTIKTFISWNVKGLNDRTKRFKILKHLKKLQTVAFLQEAHIKQSDETSLVHNDSASPLDLPLSDVKGQTFVTKHVVRDPNSRFILLHRTWDTSVITLINIYAPTSDDPDFFASITALLAKFHSSPIVMGGDFNKVLDPSLDKTGPKRHIPVRSLSAIAEIILDFQLLDIWRALHPLNKEFTFTSNPHKTCSCIDYFLIFHSLISKVTMAEILLQVISDHSPIQLSCLLSPSFSLSSRWRLNGYMLQDPKIEHQIASMIEEFLDLNNTVNQ
uniref:exodeoxyribonuclease III n=1 Tax=Latimeria chalumnae TaxID=7897 RepID=H2ZW42_LATCH